MYTLSIHTKQLSIATVRSLVREKGGRELADNTNVFPVQTVTWKLCVLTYFSQNKDSQQCKEEILVAAEK